MAIWHFRLSFIPMDYLLNVYGAIPIFITDDEILELNPWQNKSFDYSVLDNYMQETEPDWGHGERRIWGNEKTSSVRVLLDSNGNVEWVAASIDQRGSDLLTPQMVVDIARQINCVLQVNNSECFEADLDILMKHIRNSLAYKFCHNPRQSLVEFGEQQNNKKKKLIEYVRQAIEKIESELINNEENALLPEIKNYLENIKDEVESNNIIGKYGELSKVVADFSTFSPNFGKLLLDIEILYKELF